MIRMLFVLLALPKGKSLGGAFFVQRAEKNKRGMETRLIFY
jgi:hypothetical protein